MIPQLLWARCHDCRKKHPIHLVPGKQTDNQLQDWWVKHQGHRIDYVQECRNGLEQGEAVNRLKMLARKRAARRWKQTYDDNTNDLVAYVASAAHTITLASLATDSSLLAGRQSTPINNTSNLYLDYVFTITKITTGTSPTAAKQIEVWLFQALDDSPTYGDAFSTADANRSTASSDQKAAECAPVVIFPTGSSSNISWSYRGTSVAAAFGQPYAPKYHGVYVVHNTGVNLNATGGNHVLSYYGTYSTS